LQFALGHSEVGMFDFSFLQAKSVHQTLSNQDLPPGLQVTLAL
jgi:hypothetical protein